MKNSSIEIVEYEPWMKEQIISMFAEQYSIAFESFAQIFDNFYEHPFQSDKCLRIVAVREKEVVGFQSFFYWPMKADSRTFQVYQSGNSLVSPSARGQGVFGRMLGYVMDNRDRLRYDFLIGFPVEMSFGSFIRLKWDNPFDLEWRVKYAAPIRSLFMSTDRLLNQGFTKSPRSFPDVSREKVEVAIDRSFLSYREGYMTGQYYYYTYDDGDDQILFTTKVQKRKKYLTELIIGKIQSTTSSAATQAMALKALVGSARKSGSIFFISVAFNPLDESMAMVLQQQNFRPIANKIHFITYGQGLEDAPDYTKWSIFRADIDTW